MPYIVILVLLGTTQSFASGLLRFRLHGRASLFKKEYSVCEIKVVSAHGRGLEQWRYIASQNPGSRHREILELRDYDYRRRKAKLRTVKPNPPRSHP